MVWDPSLTLLTSRRSGTGSLQVRIDGLGSRPSKDILGGSVRVSRGGLDPREKMLFFFDPAGLLEN